MHRAIQAPKTLSHFDRLPYPELSEELYSFVSFIDSNLKKMNPLGIFVGSMSAAFVDLDIMNFTERFTIPGTSH